MGEFIVSARKYRPATFNSVVGQNHITSTLKNAIERSQLAHAYLFCGPRGVGKTTCARIFAKAINCLNPNGNEACNECDSCRSFNENRSLNIHELDAASNNTVDDIRSLIEQVRIIPQLGRYALFIIDEVHMLSAAAFNAFLKTLEEPPAHAIFILATTEKHKILPTILSRCQIFDFNRIKVEDGVGYLRYIAGQENIEVDDESLNLIAQKADGGMRDALSMFDKAVSFCGSTLDYKRVAQTLNILDYDTYFTITESLLAGSYVDSLLAFDKVLTQGFSAQTFMAGLNAHCRDLLVAKNPASLSLMEYTESLTQRYVKQAEQCSIDFLFGTISVLTEADGKLRQSSNQRLLVELGLMKIAGLGQKKNSEVGNYLDVEIALPELGGTKPLKNEELKVVVSQPTEISEIKNEQQVKVVAEPKVEYKAETKAEPKVAPKAEPATKSTVKTVKVIRPLVSLSDILNGGVAAKESEATEQKQESRIDPRSEELLEASRTNILEFIASWRPRFAVPFSAMEFQGHTIVVKIPTSELQTEIERSMSELLHKIVEITGIVGVIELKLILDETIVASRPVKLEDKIAHLVKINPEISKLKERFNLYIE
ncbi:MAG: DNA polymerase III subunit gamma/tau [Rikenellaceae bacterium]